MLLDDGKDANGQTQEERLQNLADFQVSIIEHAMKCKFEPTTCCQVLFDLFPPILSSS